MTVDVFAFEAFGRVVLYFLVVVAMLFLGFVMFARAEKITRGKRNIIRALVYLLAVLYVAAGIIFLILPQKAVIPALAAVFGSIVLGVALGKSIRVSVGEKEAIILCLLPAFVGVYIFYYYPITQTLLYSLHDLRYTANWIEANFIGLGNYIRVIQTRDFRNALGFTLYFTALAVFLQFWIGLGMAMTTFWISRRFTGILRAIIIIPWAIPPIINASIWRWLFNADVGVGAFLEQIGIVKKAPLFLVEPIWAMHSVILADVWKWSSLMAIFLLGALAIIPQDIYDAAKVDGARGWFRFRRITLPLVFPTIIVALLYRSMDALRTFDLIYGLTRGGPGTATETLSSFAYKYYFTFSRFGLGSAYAIAVFLFIAVLSIIYVNRIRRNMRFRT